MKSTQSPLEQTASIPLLRRLLTAGVLSVDEVKRLETRIRQDLPWRLWLDRGLLILSVILIVSGVGYFFAHNWQRLTENDKLGLSAGSVLIAFIAAVWAGADHFLGKVLLLAASLLVGVFIAVFGQIFQSSADTYELFRAWALLIFPWVLLGRFVPLWLFWLVLINLAVGLYWPVSWYFFINSSDVAIFRCVTLSLFAINLIALILREFARKLAWMDHDWSAWLLLAAALIPATIEVTYEIIRTWNYDVKAPSGTAFCAIAGHGVLLLSLVFYFGRICPSLPALALGTLSACWVLTILAIRFISGNQPPFESGQWLLLGFLVLAIFGGGVFLLRLASQKINP